MPSQQQRRPSAHDDRAADPAQTRGNKSAVSNQEAQQFRVISFSKLTQSHRFLSVAKAVDAGEDIATESASSELV